MIPFFALIGLVTVISIIVNLQINRHSLFNKIIGTVILTFACIFSCLAILYPLYFGSYENLIITFVAAFILLIGIYAVFGLVVNRRRLKNVVYVSAEGSDVTADYGKTKELIKPVQLKPAQVPKTKRRGQTSQNDRKAPVVKREKQLNQYGLSDSAATEKESATLSGIIQPERPSFDGDFNRAMPRMMMKDLGMELETGTIEEAIVMEAEQTDGSVSFKDIDTEPQVQTEVSDMDAEQMISVEPATEEDIEPQAEPEDIELDNEEMVSFESATDEYAEPQAEPEDSDMDAELMVGYESATEEDEEDAELQADTETSDIESERVGYAIEEDVEPQTQTESNDMDAELMVGYESAIEEDVKPQAEPEDSDMDAELMVGYESATEEDEEDAELQADTEAGDIDTERVEYAIEEDVEPQTQTGDSNMDAELMVGYESAIEEYEEDAELQADTETDDIDTERVEYAVEEDAEPQTQTESRDMGAELMVGYESAIEEEEDAELQADTEASGIDAEQVGCAAEEDVEPQAQTEDCDIDAELMVSVQYATDEAIELQVQTEDSDMDAEQVVSVITVEDKYSRMITKALELKNQRQYLNAIFILQSVYDSMDEILRKQADMQLMECFILSGQFYEGQKKLFDILNKKYDFEPDEKAKLKAMMLQLNARQL